MERVQRKLRHANTVEEAKTGHGADLFRNEDYERKIAQVQAEFQALLNKPSTSPRKQAVGDKDMNQFYNVMDEFYGGKVKKHESPTRRLMQ